MPRLMYKTLRNGSTPLHVAVSEDNRDVVQVLLQAGANVNAQDKYKRTPLSFAKSEEVRKLLKASGAK